MDMPRRGNSAAGAPSIKLAGRGRVSTSIMSRSSCCTCNAVSWFVPTFQTGGDVVGGQCYISSMACYGS